MTSNMNLPSSLSALLTKLVLVLAVLFAVSATSTPAPAQSTCYLLQCTIIVGAPWCYWDQVPCTDDWWFVKSQSPASPADLILGTGAAKGKGNGIGNSNGVRTLSCGSKIDVANLRVQVAEGKTLGAVLLAVPELSTYWFSPVIAAADTKRKVAVSGPVPSTVSE